MGEVYKRAERPEKKMRESCVGIKRETFGVGDGVQLRPSSPFREHMVWERWWRQHSVMASATRWPMLLLGKVPK